MDDRITYLNTDLDLCSPDDLTALAKAFEACGVRPLHVTCGDDGRWYAKFETREQHAEPEPDIAAMLAVVELLTEPLRSTWDGCQKRDFNVGYDCGAEPWAFNQGLSAELLGRMAAARASFRITLYPDREQRTASEPWYSARCLFRNGFADPSESKVYEERIVLIRAESFEDAIRQAEQEAREYVAESNDIQYLGYVDVYHLFEEVVGDGTEIFSLLRTSKLGSGEYLSRHFDTGTERTRKDEEGDGNTP